MHKNERILVIADGAAFGSEIDRVMQLIGGKDQVVLYLPESFEWLILKAKSSKKQMGRSGAGKAVGICGKQNIF